MVRGKEPREMGVWVVVTDKVSFYFYSQAKTYTKYDQTGLNNHRIKKKKITFRNPEKKLSTHTLEGGRS